MLLQEDKNQKIYLDRLDWLDRVKGIGILFVVIGHIYVEDGFFSRIIHGLNVPLFFLASGYLGACKREWERPGRALLSRKVRSLLLPYFTYSAVMMIWLLVRLYLFHYGSFAEIIHCLADIVCLEGISVLWFLSALFIGQMFFLFSLKFAAIHLPDFAKNQKIRLAVTAMLFFLFAALAFAVTRFIGWMELSSGGVVYKLIVKASRILDRGIMAYVFMLEGMFLSQLEERYQRAEPYKTAENYRKILPLCLVLLLSFIGLWYNGLRDFHYLSFGCFPLYLLNGFLGFLAVSLIGRLLAQDKILTFFGRNSLVIMATHLIFLDFINLLALRLSILVGRYLGDEREMKLIILMAAELLLLGVRRRISVHR